MSGKPRRNKAVEKNQIVDLKTARKEINNRFDKINN